MSIRSVKSESVAKPSMEGAGVHLHRVFGFGDTTQTDPFLMMDDFRNDDPSKYAAGFPWHPHRGIETITYVLAGSVEHADSLGNTGELGPGSVQWMTAGSGILLDAYRNAFAYIFSGSATFKNSSAPIGIQLEKEINGEEIYMRDKSGNRTLVLFDTGDEIVVETRDESVRFLLCSGKALNEPVAWHGPIVMNTQEQIKQAIRELKDGSFIRESAR
jgi:redox-sensitive bicupin YhaK (pirin superfamily)